MVQVRNREVAGTGPVSLAEWLVEEVWTEEGRQRLWRVGQAWWEWVGGEVRRWVARDDSWVRARVYEALSQAVVVTEPRPGRTVSSSVQVDKKVVDYVMDAMDGRVRWWGTGWPRWIGEPRTNAQWTVAFEDVCVDVLRSAQEDRWVTTERDESWFSPAVVPCRWSEAAECPLFDRCMREWGGGEEAWEEAADRMYGYAMVSYRGYAKWANEYGVPRGGKGTRARLLGRMMGKEWVGGTLMDEMAGRFGLEAIVDCKVLVVDECRRIDEGRGGRVASIVRAAVGRSEVQVDMKGVKAARVELPFLVVAIGNDPLVLPNRNMGLSSKMVALPFERSFLGKEDWGLEEKLWAERGGVARRWMEGLVRMVKENGAVPQTRAAAEMVREFEARSAGDWGQCVTDMFVRDEGWQMSTQMVVEMVRRWERENGLTLKDEEGRALPDRKVVGALKEKGPWPIRVEKVWVREEQESLIRVIGLKPKG